MGALFTATTNDWIIADATPDGYEFEIAIEGRSFRQSVWNNSNTGGRITLTQIIYDPGTAPESPGGTSYAVNEDGISVGVTGDGTRIDVHTTGLDDTATTNFVNQLRLGSRSAVPGEVIEAPDPMFGGDLVFAESRNGSLTLATALARDGGWCVDFTPNGGGCPYQLRGNAPITEHGGGSSLLAEGESVIRAGASGLAADNVATVEVRFVDGTIVEVIPTDLSAATGVRFWNVTTTIDLGTPSNLDEPLIVVETVTAYDEAGNALARDTGSGPRPVEPD